MSSTVSHIDATKIEGWSQNLGLLPIRLFPQNESKKNQFILLNGSTGNFCLDLTGGTIDNPRDYAWSSDVGHFINLKKDFLELHRWDKGNSFVEKIPLKAVSDNIDKFYSYLNGNQPSYENSVVNHVIRIFRKLRNCIKGKANGTESLKAFLYLLACAADSKDREKLKFETWNLNLESQQIAGSIRPGDWEELMSELLKGIKYFDIKPNLSLILRHTTGKLFQEAHYETIFFNNYQLTIDGILFEPNSRFTKDSSVGVHFTPSSLARTLVEESFLAFNPFGQKEVRIFDPACGSGEFLRESLRQLKAKNFKGKVHLVGWDISYSAIDMARFVLAFETKEWALDRVTYSLEVKDSLSNEVKWDSNFDIILMNPPFVSWEDMNVNQKDSVRLILGELNEKRTDYSSAFFWKAAQSLKNNGVIGAIIPSSILSGHSNQKLRSSINEIVKPYLVGRLGSQVIFSDALVDSAMFIGLKNLKPSEAPIALWADHQINSSSTALRELRKFRLSNNPSLVLNENNFSIYQNKDLGSNFLNWTPRSFNSWKLIEKYKNFSKVGDIFSIQQGARTGHNPVFVVEKSYFKTLPSIEQKYFRPAVINKSLKGGQLDDSYYVFYPFGKNLSIESETELKKNLKKYYKDYLLKNKEILAKRARKDLNSWWKLSEHRAWQVDKFPKLISAYFGQAGSFAFDNKGNYVVVQGFCWLPKDRLIDSFTKEVYMAYLAILHSPFIDELLGTVCSQVGGGQFELSKRYIEHMPLPDLTKPTLKIEVFKKLVSIGIEINSGQALNKDLLNELTLSIYK